METLQEQFQKIYQDSASLKASLHQAKQTPKPVPIEKPPLVKPPPPDHTLIWVPKGGIEYQLFLERLIEANEIWNLPNNELRDYRRYICLQCWGFLKGHLEKNAHLKIYKDHSVVRSFEGEGQFWESAREWGRVKGQEVAIISTRCVKRVQDEEMFGVKVPEMRKGKKRGPKPAQAQVTMSQVLQEEEDNGDRLDQATADDVLLFARKAKIMRQKYTELYKQVKVVYEMKVNGRSYEDALSLN